MMPRQELASFQEQVSWGPQRYCSDSTSHAVIAEATILAGQVAASLPDFGKAAINLRSAVMSQVKLPSRY